METICHDEPNVIFVGCIHKNFEAYADRLSKDDAVVMSARLTPVDLFNEGIEEIIGAIVETDKESENWKRSYAEGRYLRSAAATMQIVKPIPVD